MVCMSTNAVTFKKLHTGLNGKFCDDAFLKGSLQMTEFGLYILDF
jgi:hypothetical protein